MDAAMLVMGSMIGSGIFIVSADIARTVGGAGWLLVVWLVTGVLTLMAALCYGELAGMMPRAGGPYVYLREAYGPLVGFLYGWTLFMVIQTGTIAAVAMAFAKFTAVLAPGAAVVIVQAGRFTITGAQLIAIAVILLLTAVNMRGIHGGKILQDVFTITKIAALGLLILAGFAAGSLIDTTGFWEFRWTHLRDGVITSVETLSGAALLPVLGVAMVGSLFSSDAWYNVTNTAAEVMDPRKTVPRALALGTAAVTALYLAVNVVYLMLLPVQGEPGAADAVARGIAFAADDRVGTAAAQVIFGGAGAVIMAVLIMISTFGCNNGIILSGARVYYAMADDGLFFKRAGVLNDRGVPGAALVMQALWAALLCLTGTYGDLLDYVIFAVLVFYSLTVAGLVVLRLRQPLVERPYRVHGYPVTPVLYVVLAMGIAASLLVYKPTYTWPGFIIVLAGIPAYLVWKRKGHLSEKND